jgi:hypothetical protein
MLLVSQYLPMPLGEAETKKTASPNGMAFQQQLWHF